MIGATPLLSQLVVGLLFLSLPSYPALQAFGLPLHRNQNTKHRVVQQQRQQQQRHQQLFHRRWPAIMRRPNTAVRKNAASAAAPATAAQNADDAAGDGNQKYRKSALAALDSMNLCWKAVFATTLVDLLLAFLDPKLAAAFWQNFSAPTWFNIATVLDNLSGIGFGIGLYRLARVHKKTFVDADESDFGPNEVRAVLQTHNDIWFFATVNLVVAAMTTVTELKEYTGRPVWLVAGPAGVGATALLVGVGLRWYAQSRIGQLLTGKPTTNTTQKKTVSSSSGDGSAASPGQLRDVGLSASQSMAYCVGAFALFGTCQATMLLASPSSLLEKVFSISTPVETFAIGAIVATMWKAFTRTVVDITAENSRDDDFQLYAELYESKNKVFRRIGKVLISATVFDLLPYLYNGIVPLLGLSSWKLEGFI